MSNVNSNGNDNYDYASSTILTSKFGYTSAKLIHSVEKNLYIVLAVILSIATLSLLNTFGVLNHLYLENVDYYVDLILSVVLITVVAPLVALILKSRNVLDKWNDMFERNTIMTSLNIAMSDRTQYEALKALSYSIGEIGEPLQAYIDSRKTDLSEFFDVKVSDDYRFDVLVDKNVATDDNSAIVNNLRNNLRDYGSIAVRIVEGVIDKKTVELFVQALSAYVTSTNNEIGLGLVIGDEVTRDAQDFLTKKSYFKKKRVNNLLLIEKPSIPSIQK